MKKLNLIPGLLLLALACAGCQGHKEYDIDQVNLQMTLFEDGLVVPVGSAGPFTAELALKPIDSFLTKLDGLTWGAAAQVRIYRFRLHAGMQNGFGGTAPYTSMPLKANAKTLVVGLTFDL